MGEERGGRKMREGRRKWERRRKRRRGGERKGEEEERKDRCMEVQRRGVHITLYIASSCSFLMISSEWNCSFCWASVFSSSNICKDASLFSPSSILTLLWRRSSTCRRSEVRDGRRGGGDTEVTVR